MKAWTDYPFTDLGDIPGFEAPVRECQVLTYDWNKYCRIVIDGYELEVRIGYVYRSPGRSGGVKIIDKWKTKNPDGRPYWKFHKRRSHKVIWYVSGADGSWYDFETKRDAIRKLLTLPDFSSLYCDGHSNKRSWLRPVLEKRPFEAYRMKRRYGT